MLRHCVEGCWTPSLWSWTHGVLINQSGETVFFGLDSVLSAAYTCSSWPSDKQLVPWWGLRTKFLGLVFSQVEYASLCRNLSDSAAKENSMDYMRKYRKD